MIRCVMFDFGNVLVHFDTQMFYDFIAARQRPCGVKPEQFFHSEFVVRYDIGQVDDQEFFELSREALCLDVGRDEFFSAFTSNMKGPDKIIMKLKRILRQNGIKLAVVSNMNRCHYAHVQQRWPEVLAGFDYLALSFQIGLRKPHPRIWLDASERLWVRPKECFFVDDLMGNVSAFERLGGTAHHYPVMDEKFCPNGNLETERNKLIIRMVNLGLLNLSQAGSLLSVTF